MSVIEQSTLELVEFSEVEVQRWVFDVFSFGYDGPLFGGMLLSRYPEPATALSIVLGLANKLVSTPEKYKTFSARLHASIAHVIKSYRTRANQDPYVISELLRTVERHCISEAVAELVELARSGDMKATKHEERPLHGRLLEVLCSLYDVTPEVEEMASKADIRKRNDSIRSVLVSEIEDPCYAMECFSGLQRIDRKSSWPFLSTALKGALLGNYELPDRLLATIGAFLRESTTSAIVAEFGKTVSSLSGAVKRRDFNRIGQRLSSIGPEIYSLVGLFIWLLRSCRNDTRVLSSIDVEYSDWPEEPGTSVSTYDVQCGKKHGFYQLPWSDEESRCVSQILRQTDPSLLWPTKAQASSFDDRIAGVAA